MTIPKIETILFEQHASLATLVASEKTLRVEIAENKQSYQSSTEKMLDSIASLSERISEFGIRLALIERELGDLRSSVDRGRSRGTAVVVAVIGAVLSFLGSTVIAIYVRPK